jgi:hypothetical protein
MARVVLDEAFVDDFLIGNDGTLGDDDFSFDNSDYQSLELGGGHVIRRPTALSAAEVLSSVAAPSGIASLSFLTFAKLAFSRSVCLRLLESDESRFATLAFCDYDYPSCVPTKGKPVSVEVDYTTIGKIVSVRFPCYASVVARRATEVKFQGIEKKQCYHTQLAFLAGALEKMVAHPVTTCDPVTGLPSAVSIAVLSVLKAPGTAIPQRAYVHVQGPPKPGLRRGGTLIISRCAHLNARGLGYNVSCDACGNGSKVEKGMANRKKCGHFQLLHEILVAEDVAPELMLIRTLIFHKPPAAPDPGFYDETTQQYCFPSLERDIAESRRNSSVPIAPL